MSEPSRFRRQDAVLDAILHLLIPLHPEMDEVPRSQAREDATRYLSAQIESMPGALRVPYKVALHAFDTLPVLRHFRRFVALSPARQQAYLAFWSDAPLAPMRDFVKLIRSSGLLAYYDHPLVVQRLIHERDASTRPRSAGSRT